MENEPYIRLQNASVGYTGKTKNTVVLHDIHLEFYTGDFIALVGLNGSGKSTLLKSMSGLLPLLNGHVFLNGKNINEMPFTEIATKVSVVLTEKIGGFNLTAFDAVAAGQIPYTNAFHQLKQEHLSAINSAIEAVGIKEHAHKPIQELSDGLFQKTMIARALAQHTPAILLDEPSAFLDYASKHELFLLLKKLATEENKCILVSSHDLDLALKYCSRILVVADEKTILLSTSEAKDNTQFKKITGGFI